MIGAVLLLIYIHNSHRIAALQRELQAIHESPAALPPADVAHDTPPPTETAAPRVTPGWTAVPTEAPWYLRTYQKTDGAILDNMRTLQKRNRDLIGWIEAEKVFSLPVVYRNNTYYLDRDFEKQKNVSGTVFLDEHTPFSARTQHLVLHGHNMKDGSMFAHLPHWKDKGYLRQHPILRFSTLYREETYVIFAAMQISTNPQNPLFFNVAGHPSFPGDEAFSAWLDSVKRLTLYGRSFDVTRDDALLTLSTCVGDDRFIVLARRLRTGETEAEAIRSVGL